MVLLVYLPTYLPTYYLPTYYLPTPTYLSTYLAGAAAQVVEH